MSMRVSGAAVILLCVALCLQAAGGKKEDTVTLSVNGRPLTARLAVSEKERRTGLMGVEHLEWNEGMLFIFEQEEDLSFWMKNTKISLSIAFLDENGKVTDIFDMEPYSLEPVRSSVRCRYALEVNRGFFEESGLGAGDSIDIDLEAINSK